MLKSFSRLFVFYKDYRGRLILSQVLLIISAVSMLGVAALSQYMINEGIEAGDISVLVDTAIWMTVLTLVSGSTMAGTAALAVFFSQGTAYVIRDKLYRKIQTFSFANFDRFRTGNLLVRLNADVVNIQNAVMYSVMLILYAPFMMLVALVLALITTPSLIWLMLVVAAVILVIMFFLAPQIFRAYDARQKRLDDLNNTLQENLSAVRVVKAFVREDLEMKRFKTRAEAMRTPAAAAAFRVAFFAPLLTCIAQVAVAASVWAGGAKVLAHTGMSVGQVMAFMQYLSMMVMPLALMAIVIPFILRGDTSAGRIFEIFDTEPVVEDRPDPVRPDQEKTSGKIIFEDVSFAYRRPDGSLDPPVLKNINLTLDPGEKIGFLGATGSGKTTMVNLIPRFYDVTEGRITIDGIDVRDYSQNNLRETVGIALQEAVLFQGDLRFNLKFGAPDTDDDTMIKAARASDAYEFVKNLPKKWKAPVARRGYNFSGGQRQRLSMGRTLTPGPKILIMDDSTSALDVETESRVQTAIPEKYPAVTILYVAQRISAVIDLDKIVLLEDGTILDIGTHEELLERSPLYQEIYESQLGSGVMAGLEVE